MKYKKFNKYEKKVVRKEMITQALAGYGKYLYQNSSKAATLTLPRPTASGLRHVGPGQQFQGDDYYMQLVKSGDLRLVEVLQTAEQENAAKAGEQLLTEAVTKQEARKEKLMSDQKLIVEQPATVTSKGTVERVVEGTAPKKGKKALRETEEKKATPDVLLNESPDGDGFVIVNS